MSKNGDYVRQSLYGAHLNGDRAKYANSPTDDRMGAHQRMHIKRLTELCANRFEWKGLPPEIDPRFLEMNLFYRALSVFFKDKINGKFFVMKGAPNGPWDITDNPTAYTVTGNQFVSRILSAVRTYKEVEGEIVPTTEEPECVPIWANYLRVPDLDVVLIYAWKFAELDVTIEINSRNARRNKVVIVDENQNLTAANIVRQMEEGNNFIKLNQAGATAVPTALDLGIQPDSIEKLHILRVRLENECMGMLGIDNANQDKKERLVANEVDANNGQTQSSRNVALNARRDAAKQINELYGLNVTVDFHKEEPTTGDDVEKNEEPSGPNAVKMEEAA